MHMRDLISRCSTSNLPVEFTHWNSTIFMKSRLSLIFRASATFLDIKASCRLAHQSKANAIIFPSIAFLTQRHCTHAHWNLKSWKAEPWHFNFISDNWPSPPLKNVANQFSTLSRPTNTILWKGSRIWRAYSTNIRYHWCLTVTETKLRNPAKKSDFRCGQTQS